MGSPACSAATIMHMQGQLERAYHLYFHAVALIHFFCWFKAKQQGIVEHVDCGVFNKRKVSLNFSHYQHE